MSLTRLVYYSENQLNPAHGSILSQLSKILGASNRNNKAKNITGALVFDDLWFLQILEGEREIVWSTFNRINDDERHSRVMLAEMRDVEDRIFGNWWMGLVTRDEVTEVAFRPYMVDGRLQPGRMSARDILALTIEISKLSMNRAIKNVDAA